MNSEENHSPAHKYKPFDMMVAIVDRDLGEIVAEHNRSFDIPVNIVCLGRGTADSYWTDLLGIGSPEKDIVLSFVPVEHARAALDNLVEKMDLHACGKGIAFTMPVNSVAGSRVLHYFIEASLQEDSDER